MVIIVIFVFLVGGGFFVGKIVGNILFPKNDNDCTSGIDKPNIFNNYITENHLHISKEDLKSLKGKD